MMDEFEPMFANVKRYMKEAREIDPFRSELPVEPGTGLSVREPAPRGRRGPTALLDRSVRALARSGSDGPGAGAGSRLALSAPAVRRRTARTAVRLPGTDLRRKGPAARRRAGKKGKDEGRLEG